MAEINLNDLLAKKQAEATEDTPTIETTELVRVNQQVETLTPEERKQVDQIKKLHRFSDVQCYRPIRHGCTGQHCDVFRQHLGDREKHESRSGRHLAYRLGKTG